MAFKTKLSVAIAHFPYSGNGAAAKEHPDIRNWEVRTALQARFDERISSFGVLADYNDTPITMTRNAACLDARRLGYDLLLMIDSDQSPCRHEGESWYKPFWDEAFNFIYENYHKGPRLIFAPYCGGQENVFVFKWEDGSSSKFHDPSFSLEPYDRQEAALMSGIHPAAAGPTGMILIDLRLLDLIEPSGLPRREVLERVQTGQMSVEEALWALREGFFYYEWENSYAAKKASTEDVTFTRDIALAGVHALGYNPVFCAWDSWIGHYKPVNVGKPQRFASEDVGAALHKAFSSGLRRNEACLDLSQTIDPQQFNGNGRIGPMAIVHPPGANGHVVRSDVMTKTGRETVGPWHVHGHAPEEHKEALADLVRSCGYRKQPEQDELQILEVGSWLGSTAIAMADASCMARVHCVDTWQGSPSDLTGDQAKLAIEEEGENAVYKRFIANIGPRHNKTIFAWQGTSEEMAKKAWPKKFDLIFIDAEHTYEALKAQILEWWPHLAADGVMCGHDFLVHGYDGVGDAVRELFGERHAAFGFTPQGCMWRVDRQDHHNLLEKLNGSLAGV